jgi:hypothetical protein
MPRPNSEEMDFESYLNKPPTKLHEHLAEWILEKTGYDPAAEKSKLAAFNAGIRLGAQLRMAHQASPENQKRIAVQRSESEKAAVERAANMPAPKVKAGNDDKPAPARRVSKAAAAKAAAAEAAAPVVEAKPAPRRRPAKAASSAAPAPF